MNTADEAAKLRKAGVVVEIGVQHHRTVAFGGEHFGQTGTIGYLYRHFGIDAATIVARAKGLTLGVR